ncbi:MAG: anthranilate phosphoribosyltransferase [Gammaproteobacteria bacterium]|nr:anthranilate phosphoribosyltransferase [Gammaproteobacteria bacterium]
MKTVEPADAQLMRSAIQRVATGPELSKNLSSDEAQAVTQAILDGTADPVQAGVFLIGLRMKRETDDELYGVLDALRQSTETVVADLDNVVAIAEPYNGFNRTVQGSLFSLPVLAACGVPVYSHGVELVGPKFGITHHNILKALGGNPLHSVEQVASQLANSDIGWGYIDQRSFAPKLEALNTLRNQIVKRPVLSTTEVLLCPIKASGKTHLITGYVHKPYRETYVKLARHVHFDSLLLVRGTEGGVIPSFRADVHVVRYSDTSNEQELDIPLEPLDLSRNYRAMDIPETCPPAEYNLSTIGMKWDIDALAELCAKEGRAALENTPGPIHDAAVLGAALSLWHIGRATDMDEAVRQAKQAIESGEALRRLEAGINA